MSMADASVSRTRIPVLYPANPYTHTRAQDQRSIMHRQLRRTDLTTNTAVSDAAAAALTGREATQYSRGAVSIGGIRAPS